MACFWAAESSARTVIGAEGIANKAEASRGFRSFIPGGSSGIPKVAQPSFSLRRKPWEESIRLARPFRTGAHDCCQARLAGHYGKEPGPLKNP